MLLISNLTFVSPVYMSVVPQLKVDCLSVGLPNFSPMPINSLLNLMSASAMVIAIICTAALVASMAACVIAWVIF